jgi:hypothetical protein
METKITARPQYNSVSMWKEVLNSARFTVGKSELTTEPTDDFKRNIIAVRHSPIRNYWVVIDMLNIPNFASQQMSRHIISGRHEQVQKTDSDDFVQTQRADRTNKKRSERKQTDPVNHKIVANIQGLIDMSKKRLCKKADPVVQTIWSEVVNKIYEFDTYIAVAMQSECILSGGVCFEDCNYRNSKSFRMFYNIYMDKFKNTKNVK